MDIAIIPAYNPDDKLMELVQELSEKGIKKIIVVDDGSDEEKDNVFQKISDMVTVMSHEENRGKGAAVKTALKYIIEHVSDVGGIVILDADGQHRPDDAIRLLNVLHFKSSGLVLGVRSFEGKIPIRSLLGNTITKYVFRAVSGKWVSDTQTGLRAFSREMIPKLLEVAGERYEYEMNVLLAFAKDGTIITEVPIKTIYHDDGNSCSHFRAIRDSLRIYGNILAFSSASFLSFLLDYILFVFMTFVFGFGMEEATGLVLANICARVISAGFNYYLNSTFVFKSKEKRVKSIVSYAILACFILVLNTAILSCLHDVLGMNKQVSKIITELILFTISFTVQKLMIFNKVKKVKGVVEL